MPYNPVVYNPGAGFAAGLDQASSAIQGMGQNLGGWLQKLGLMHMQDKASTAMLTQLQKNGMLDDDFGKALFKVGTMPGAPTGAASMAMDMLRTQFAQNFGIRKAMLGAQVNKGGFIQPGAVPQGGQNQVPVRRAQPVNQRPELVGSNTSASKAPQGNVQTGALQSVNWGTSPGNGYQKVWNKGVPGWGNPTTGDFKPGSVTNLDPSNM